MRRGRFLHRLGFRPRSIRFVLKAILFHWPRLSVLTRLWVCLHVLSAFAQQALVFLVALLPGVFLGGAAAGGLGAFGPSDGIDVDAPGVRLFCFAVFVIPTLLVGMCFVAMSPQPPVRGRRRLVRWIRRMAEQANTPSVGAPSAPVAALNGRVR